MSKVYIVTTGVYYSYRIVATFSTRKLAKQFCEQDIRAKISGTRIEAYDLDQNPDTMGFPVGYNAYEVVMDKDGVGVAQIMGTHGFLWDNKTVEWGWEYNMDIDDDVATDMRVYVVAKDSQHAMKIANERRAYLIANNLWGVAIEKVNWKEMLDESARS